MLERCYQLGSRIAIPVAEAQASRREPLIPVAIDGDVDTLLADAAERGRRYVAGLRGRAVTPDETAIAALGAFDEPLPETSGDAAATLALLDEVGSAATMAGTGGRYFGFVVGGSLPVTVAANWLARHGIRTLRYRYCRRSPHDCMRWQSAGWSICSVCRQGAAACSSAEPQWRTRPRWSRRETSSSLALVGTCRQTGSSVLPSSRS